MAGRRAPHSLPAPTKPSFFAEVARSDGHSVTRSAAPATAAVGAPHFLHLRGCRRRRRRRHGHQSRRRHRRRRFRASLPMKDNPCDGLAATAAAANAATIHRPPPPPSSFRINREPRSVGRSVGLRDGLGRTKSRRPADLRAVLPSFILPSA